MAYLSRIALALLAVSVVVLGRPAAADPPVKNETKGQGQLAGGSAERRTW